jgi:prephenate dehydratase
MSKITFLGPYGTTFSHNAYQLLSEEFGTPQVTPINLLPADNNAEVLGLIARCGGGYGALAVETLADRRVGESVESFVQFLDPHAGRSSEAPFRIVGGVAMRLHFALMAREGIAGRDVTRIVAHERSLGPCRRRLELTKTPVQPVGTNGEAARRVALEEGYETSAALGPRSAAEVYGLKVLWEAFEDEAAVTTFYLIAPHTHPVRRGAQNRALLICRVPDKPGATLPVQIPLFEEGINMVHPHWVPERRGKGRGPYAFMAGLEVRRSQLDAMERAVTRIKRKVPDLLYFPPFEVISR